MADADSPGAVLRRLVAEAVGVDSVALLADDVDLVERGDDPGTAARLSGIVDTGDTVVGVVPRADPALARRLTGDSDGDDDGSIVGVDDDNVDGRTLRLVFTGRAADRLTGPSGTVIRSVLAERGIEAYRHDGDSPIGLLLVDDRAVVGLFDESGLAALLWSDAPQSGSGRRRLAGATSRRPNRRETRRIVFARAPRRGSMKALLLLVAGIGGLIETLVPRAVVRAWTKALYRNAGEAEPREWVYAATRAEGAVVVLAALVGLYGVATAEEDEPERVKSDRVETDRVETDRVNTND